MLTRRNFLTAAPAALAAPAFLGTAAAWQSLPAWAQSTPAALLPSTARLKLGDIRITAILDCFIPMEAAILQADAGAVAAALEATPQLAPLSGHVNAFLIETVGKRYLLDAGGPAAFVPSLGGTTAALAALGVAPDSIDQVLISHLHVDHIESLTDATGAAVFTNAGLTMLTEEHAFWTQPGFTEGAPDGLKPLIGAATATVTAYADKLTLVSGETEVAPGITTLPIPGHTPGLTGFRIASGDRHLLMWADTVNVPAVQFAHPDWSVAFDTDGATAIASRARVLDIVTADRIPVLGSHLPFPGHGHVVKDGSAYRYEAAFWDAAA